MVNTDSRAILPEPPEELKQHSEALRSLIMARIRDGGPIAFSEFMEMALYEPGLGYYSAGARKFGPRGDFITAPELGNVFARSVAIQAAEIGRELEGFEVLELGAGTGRFAADYLQSLEPGCLPERYRILERSADLRQVQQRTLQEQVPAMVRRIEWLDEPPVDAWQGLLFANEVIDALPVERFRIGEQGLEQMRVDLSGNTFEWTFRPASGPLERAIAATLAGLPCDLPVGYRSEICASLPAWLKAVTGSLQRGVALFIDYGYTRGDYYLPTRGDGTLICHYRHRAHGDPFTWPGLQDISAFVDFTALAEAGQRCGLECAGYANLAMFLAGSGLPEILAGLASLPDIERMRMAGEIRQLALPEVMGEKFQCMALKRDYHAPLRGFSHSDLRYRL